MPVDPRWCGVMVELVADVEKVLDAGYVDVVDGGEVEDDGFQSRAVRKVRSCAASARAGVVPGTVLMEILAKWRTGKGRE